LRSENKSKHQFNRTNWSQQSIILQLKFYHHAVPVIQSPSSTSSPFKSKSKSLAFESKSSPSPQEIGLESDFSPSPGLESYYSGTIEYEFVRYELYRVRLGVGYELARYELEWVRVDRHPWRPVQFAVAPWPV